MKRINTLYPFIPLVVFMIIWEVFTVNSQRNTFLFSRPTKILSTLADKISIGELVHHCFATA
jgi:ABC-type nitrate/sulfonate/bicarbonate transport system permease component